MSTTDGGYGFFDPSSGASDFNRVAFQTRRMLSRLRTVVPVKVMSVSPQSSPQGGGATQGAVMGAGYVSVQPQVSQWDGNNQATQHGTLVNIPYTRIFGGNSAILMDPMAGDLGFMVVCDRDITSFKKNRGMANPGSGRIHDMADGIYIGGVLNSTPTQYITFQNKGITINDVNNNQIVLNASGVVITDKVNGQSITFNSSGITISDDNGNTISMTNGGITITATTLTVNGNIVCTGTVTDGGPGGVTLKNHLHSEVTTGSGQSGPPVSGT